MCDTYASQVTLTRMIDFTQRKKRDRETLLYALKWTIISWDENFENRKKQERGDKKL